MGRYLLLRL